MEWIKISEQLPPYDDRVLLYGIQYDYIDVGYLDKDESDRLGFHTFYIPDGGNITLNVYYFWITLT